MVDVWWLWVSVSPPQAFSMSTGMFFFCFCGNIAGKSYTSLSWTRTVETTGVRGMNGFLKNWAEVFRWGRSMEQQQQPRWFHCFVSHKIIIIKSLCVDIHLSQPFSANLHRIGDDVERKSQLAVLSFFVSGNFEADTKLMNQNIKLNFVGRKKTRGKWPALFDQRLLIRRG